jgi:flagellin
MRIQHNITALSAANKLKSNESTVSKNIQKLSSGYRINSAADDAAGLAVSEKMRKQINGLTQAEDNTKNGISLIQTAEGGLNETSAILQRMNTLAVESSNGTYKDADRENLQKEVTHLKTEIDRISTSTKFNEISLLDGSLSTSGSASTAAAFSVAGASVSTVGASQAQVETSAALFTLADGKSATYTISYKDATGAAKAITLTAAADLSGATGKITVSDGSNVLGTYAATKAGMTAPELATALSKAINTDSNIDGSFVASDDTGKLKLVSNTAGSNGESVIEIMGPTAVDGATPGSIMGTPTAGVDSYKSADFGAAGSYTAYDGTAATAKGAVFTVNGQKFAFVKKGITDTSGLDASVNLIYNNTSNATAQPDATDVAAMSNMINSKTGLKTDVNSTAINFKGGANTAGGALVFQVGAENVDDQRASLSINNMNSEGLGLTSLDISKQPGSKAAIDIISNAVAIVSSTRADLGALQNELEHTANNLSVMNENLTSAESTIRDVDMTDEYVQYSKNQILSQAANSMLAQANAQPQNVLTLLKG